MVAALATHAHLGYLRQTNSRRTSDGGIVVAERVPSAARRLKALAAALLAIAAGAAVSPVLTQSVGGLLSGAVTAVLIATAVFSWGLVIYPKRSTLRVSSQSVCVRMGLGHKLVVPLEVVSSAVVASMPTGHQPAKRNDSSLETSSMYGGAEGHAIRFDYVAPDASALSFTYVTGAAPKVVIALKHVGVRVERSRFDESRSVNDGDV